MMEVRSDGAWVLHGREQNDLRHGREFGRLCDDCDPKPGRKIGIHTHSTTLAEGS